MTLTPFTMFVFQKEDEELFLAVPPVLAGILTRVHEDMVENVEVHRPSQEEKSDFFENLEVEMANDQVASSATRNIKTVSELLYDQLQTAREKGYTEETIIIPLTAESCSSLLMWVNNLYTHSRRGLLDGFEIGSSQAGEEVNITSEELSSDTQFLLMLTQELCLALANL